MTIYIQDVDDAKDIIEICLRNGYKVTIHIVADEDNTRYFRKYELNIEKETLC